MWILSSSATARLSLADRDVTERDRDQPDKEQVILALIMVIIVVITVTDFSVKATDREEILLLSVVARVAVMTGRLLNVVWLAICLHRAMITNSKERLLSRFV